MIRTVSELLNTFATQEAKKLAEYDMDHAPTIGAMYEGLSAEIINRAIPANLDLQVVSGFVVDAQGKMSGQIDCMLVRGKGEGIPYTEDRKWPVWDVLAVFEVKKTLYGADMRDAFVHLRSVHYAFWEWLHGIERPNNRIDISRALRAFSRITGVHAPEFKKYEETLSPELALIYYTLVIEQLTPVRIVLGYGGYRTESGLRQGMINFLEQEIGAGFGIPSFPHLITCNGFSLCKANGQPYIPPLRNNCWDFLCSSPTNSVWLMLELLWTKIENVYEIEMPWEDDLVQEVFHPFIAAKPVEGKGWQYLYTTMEEGHRAPQTQEWKPVEVTNEQHVILDLVVADGCVDTRATEFIEFLKRHDLAADEFVAALLNTGFVAMDGPLIKPVVTTLHFVMTPEGHTLAGEHPGQMANFIASRSKKKKED